MFLFPFFWLVCLVLGQGLDSAGFFSVCVCVYRVHWRQGDPFTFKFRQSIHLTPEGYTSAQTERHKSLTSPGQYVMQVVMTSGHAHILPTLRAVSSKRSKSEVERSWALCATVWTPSVSAGLIRWLWGSLKFRDIRNR